MLIVTAQNVTGEGTLARPDGTSDYDVWVGINQHCLWRGSIKNHVRDSGAAVLLHTIADQMVKKIWEGVDAALADMRGSKLDKLQPDSEHPRKASRTRRGGGGEMQDKKSNHQAKIVRVTEILPHTNADTLELIRIPNTDYQVVVKKGQFKVGDRAVYVQPDSVVPQTESFKFIWGPYAESPNGGPDTEVPERRRRITVRKFRREWSEGLLLPVTDFAGIVLPDTTLFDPDSAKEDDDVSDLLGITHYDPDKGKESTGGDNEAAPAVKKWPTSLKGWYYFILRFLGLRSKNNQTMYVETGVDIPVYDVEALKNYKTAFLPGEMVIATEKIHGSNARYVFLNKKIYAGSRILWKSPSSNCVWRKALAQNPWIEAWCTKHPGYVLYGEVTPTQKGFDYGCGEGRVKFFVFDVFTPEGTWLPKEEVLTDMGLDPVPILYAGPFDLEEIKKVVDGPSTIMDAKHIREGVVIAPNVSRHIRGLGRLQLKLVSNSFLEKDSK